MMDILKQYVWETDENELKELIEDGYVITYLDVSLSVIYGELLAYLDGNIEEQIQSMFGYYGLHHLLLVDGNYYWLTLS